MLIQAFGIDVILLAGTFVHRVMSAHGSFLLGGAWQDGLRGKKSESQYGLGSCLCVFTPQYSHSRGHEQTLCICNSGRQYEKDTCEAHQINSGGAHQLWLRQIHPQILPIGQLTPPSAPTNGLGQQSSTFGLGALLRGTCTMTILSMFFCMRNESSRSSPNDRHDIQIGGGSKSFANSFSSEEGGIVEPRADLIRLRSKPSVPLPMNYYLQVLIHMGWCLVMSSVFMVKVAESTGRVSRALVIYSSYHSPKIKTRPTRNGIIVSSSSSKPHIPPHAPSVLLPRRPHRRPHKHPPRTRILSPSPVVLTIHIPHPKHPHLPLSPMRENLPLALIVMRQILRSFW